MHKRSHILFARRLWASLPAPPSRLCRVAFLIGSVQPDCNPLSYCKGSLRARPFHGHHWENARFYITKRIHRLSRCSHWGIWQYYTLGKLTHYLADAFTYPHNAGFSGGVRSHHQYEADLRCQLNSHLAQLEAVTLSPLLPVDLALLRQFYEEEVSYTRRDIDFILQSGAILMKLCPQSRVCCIK